MTEGAIGSPPNALLAAFVNTEFGWNLSFQTWMTLALPIVIVMLPLCWLLLTKVIFPLKIETVPRSKTLFKDELRSLGKMQQTEWIVLTVFTLVAICWMFRPVLQKFLPAGFLFDDASIAILGAAILFALPSGNQEQKRILTWTDTKLLPWGVLLLFGGGLSLAKAMSQNGVTTLIGDSLSVFGSVHPFFLIMLVTIVIVFLTEVTSNTATAAAFFPVIGAVAVAVDVNPYLLLFPAAFGASCAFMMPVATPPNALVFASNRVTIPQMCKAGLLLNIVSIIIISIYVYLVQAWF